MQVELSEKAKEHLAYWQKTNNQIILKKIEAIFDAILQNPYNGMAKPEPLKHQLSGKWSRRITHKQRFVYAIDNNTLKIYSLKGHYL